MTKRKKKPTGTRQRTIAVELHNEWRNQERKGDSDAIATKLGVSKPTIDKALIYGCVHQQAIIDGINKYFADRLTNEREAAQNLKGLRTDQPAEEVA